jgi:zinc/manganese transport system substrate-binding protein
MSDADPDHADTYQANAADLQRELQQLVDRQTALRADLEGTPVATTEPVPEYLIDALGLEDQTPAAFSEAIEEGEDVSVTVLNQTLDLFRDDKVRALVYNDQTTGATTEAVQDAAEAAGISVVPVSETLPDGLDYVSWMSDNTEAVASAVSGR